MLKKLSCLLLALALLLSFAACGSEEPVATDPTTEPTTQPTEPISVFEPQVLVDNEQITITVTDYCAGDVEDSMPFTVVNKTESAVYVSFTNPSVNGAMYQGASVSVLVGAKETVEESLVFLREDPALMDIGAVTEVEFTLSVMEGEDFSKDPIVEDTFIVYPLGAEAVVEYTRPQYHGETVVADNDNCTIIVLNCVAPDEGGYQTLIYLQNKTDKTLSFFVDNAMLSGKDCDPLWSLDVAPGKHAVSPIVWDETTLQKAGVTSVNSLLLELRVIDANNWLASPILTKDVEIQTN